MKRLYVFLALIVLTISGFAQPQLTWRIANPRITNFTPESYLSFEIQVKASSASPQTYCAALQANFEYNITAFGSNNIDVTIGNLGISSGTYDPPGPVTSKNKYNIDANFNGGKINAFVTADFGGYTPSTNVSTYFNPVTTDWQPLCLISLRIVEPSASPNLIFSGVTMDNMEFYVYQGAPLPGLNNKYLAPNLFDTLTNIEHLSLQRIFSSAYGWSQYGPTNLNEQFVDWTVPNLNTTIWDTTSTAAIIGDPLTIPAGGGNVGATDVIVNDFRVLAGARAVIQAGKSLTCNGSTVLTQVPGALKLESDATQFGQFIDNGVTYTGGATAWAYRGVTQSQWHMLSIPMQSVMARESFQNYFLQYWLEPSNSWKQVVAMPSDSALTTQGLGYFLWSDPLTPPTNGTIKHVGQLNTGTIAYSNITHTGALNGYNLLGNPYPSALDLGNAGVTWGSDLEQKAWVWDPTQGDYRVYVKTGGSTRSQYIPPQQGFWVHKGSAGTTSITLTNATRTINSEPFLKEEISDLLFLETTLPSKPNSGMASVRFTDAAAAGYDENYDAQLMRGGPETPQIYSLISDATYPELTVNALPWTGVDQEVPLGFDCSVSGTFTITASNMESFREGTVLFLQDLLNGHTQNLNLEPSYTFDYEAGADPARFLLLFTNPYFGINDKSNQSLHIFSYSHDFYVKNSGNTQEGDVALFDLAGRKVFGSRLQPMAVNRYTPNVTGGFYVVRVITGSQVTTEKIYIQ